MVIAGFAKRVDEVNHQPGAADLLEAPSGVKGIEEGGSTFTSQTIRPWPAALAASNRSRWSRLACPCRALVPRMRCDPRRRNSGIATGTRGNWRCRNGPAGRRRSGMSRHGRSQKRGMPRRAAASGAFRRAPDSSATWRWLSSSTAPVTVVGAPASGRTLGQSAIHGFAVELGEEPAHFGDPAHRHALGGGGDQASR